MDGRSFDAWTRRLAGPRSRRAVVAAALGGVLGAVGLGGPVAADGDDDDDQGEDDDCKRAGKRCKKDKQCCAGLVCDGGVCAPACTPTCAANRCGGDGCGGTCECAAGRTCLSNGTCALACSLTAECAAGCAGGVTIGCTTTVAGSFCTAELEPTSCDLGDAGSCPPGQFCNGGGLCSVAC
jgi:hypothetical protein